MKSKQYLIVAIVSLLVFTVGITYAFYEIIGGSAEIRNVGIQTYTTDNLIFNVSKDIEIEADETNFYENAGNQTDSATATARLVPNGKTNSASDTYNIYVVRDTNSFIYTTEGHTPEILLTITDPNGNRVSSITGLNGSNGIFDITTRTGAFLVAGDYVISANTAAGTTQNWTMTVTLVNLETDQQMNAGRLLTGTIYITKESMETYSLAQLNSIVTSHTNSSTGEEESNITYNSIVAELNAVPGTEGVSTYYFGIEEVADSTGYLKLANQVINGIEYFESKSPSYRFTNLKENTNYIIHAFVEDGAGFKSNIYETVVKTNEYVLPQVTNVTTTVLGLNSIRVVATAQAGDSELSKYYFNCGSGWSAAQNSNTYTCNGLSYNTNYNIEVKVEDTNGRYSVEYIKPSEITAYQVTYNCAHCSSAKSTEYVLPGNDSTSTITASNHYTLTNATVSGCSLSGTTATVSNVTGNTTCNVTAIGNSITCSAGKYLPANTETCATCTGGNYCTGWSGNYDGNSHGLSACSSLGTGYTSDSGANANTGCYLAVAAGKYKTSATGTSVASCAAGSYRASHNSYYNRKN